MSLVFISYVREDIKFAKRVVQSLTTRKFDTWKDRENILPTTDWEKEIHRGIEEANAFLFMISSDSLHPKMCNKEIVHAVKNSKLPPPQVVAFGERSNHVYLKAVSLLSIAASSIYHS